MFCVLCMFVPIKLTPFCPAMTPADSCKPLTTETRLQFQANSCRINSGQKGTATTSSRRISFLICQHVSINDSYSFVRMFLSFWSNSPPVGQGHLIHEVARSHTTTHHCRWDSSGRVISPSQRPLPDNIHPCPRWKFEPTISAGERPKTLDRLATGTGRPYVIGAV